LIKHEDALKHGGRGTTNDGIDRILDRPRVSLFVGVGISRVTLADLDGVVVVVVIRDSRIVGVVPAIAPSLAPGLEGLIVSARHQSLKRIALASWSSSSHNGSSRGLMVDDYRINESIESIEVGRSSRG
jgi:hypothetical protein